MCVKQPQVMFLGRLFLENRTFLERNGRGISGFSVWQNKTTNSLILSNISAIHSWAVIKQHSVPPEALLHVLLQPEAVQESH